MRAWLVTLLFAGVVSAQSADDLLLVDCKLPAKQKRIGNRTFPVAGRPIRTTAVDCRIRGGEYTVYDRANYQTSLKIWLAEAEKGNAEAQYYVGKIYEGGLGTEPDYASAAKWYEKAASANHSASQFTLAQMYEKGQGVAQDMQKALNLYRQAAGLTGNYVIVESAQYDALARAAEELALREEQIEELQRQLEQARNDAKKQRELTEKLGEQQRRIDAQKKEIARLQTAVKSSAPAPVTKTLTAKRNTLGRYFAIVIGNGRYDALPAVPTAESDARAMAALLRDSYGFDVKLLVNAKRGEILSALYELSQNLAENDNLVVYYAGHGKRDLRNRRGWWLPADASSDNDAKKNWLPNQEVSDRLALIPARHILVLADASYVGDITRGAPQPEPQSMNAAQWTKYVENTKRKKARLALSSGSDSVSPRFTATLIDVLKKQKGVFPASRIHREVVNTLTADGKVSSAVPTYAPLQSAFHDGVDFLFEHR